MQDRNSLRLLPVVMLALGALILFKIAGQFVTDDPTTGVAVAQEADDPANMDAPEQPVAEDPEKPMEDPEAADTDPDAEPTETTETEPEAKRVFSQAEQEVLESLLARREQLEAREREVQLREKLLEAAEKRVQERIAELKVIEEKIEASFGKQEEDRKAQLQNLVSMYENMKPKDAARIFDRLDMTVLIGVVQQMKTRKMAPILAKMDAAVAERLTVELAKLAAARTTQ